MRDAQTCSGPKIIAPARISNKARRSAANSTSSVRPAVDCRTVFPGRLNNLPAHPFDPHRFLMHQSPLSPHGPPQTDPRRGGKAPRGVLPMQPSRLPLTRPCWGSSFSGQSLKPQISTTDNYSPCALARSRSSSKNVRNFCHWVSFTATCAVAAVFCRDF
jgi:hypothetical protein